MRVFFIKKRIKNAPAQDQAGAKQKHHSFVIMKTTVRLICLVLTVFEIGLLVHNAIIVDKNNGEYLELTGEIDKKKSFKKISSNRYAKKYERFRDCKEKCSVTQSALKLRKALL